MYQRDEAGRGRPKTAGKTDFSLVPVLTYFDKSSLRHKGVLLVHGSRQQDLKAAVHAAHTVREESNSFLLLFSLLSPFLQPMTACPGRVPSAVESSYINEHSQDHPSQTS